jgi:hypothetical protein
MLVDAGDVPGLTSAEVKTLITWLAGLSTKDVIVTVARDAGDGAFQSAELAEFLAGLGMFPNRRKASDAVRSAIRRNREVFHLVAPGEYDVAPDYEVGPRRL